MKKVVSVVTAPFRAIGRLLLKALRSLRLVGRPFVKLAALIRKLVTLRGKARVVVYGVIAIAVVALVVILKPAPNDEQKVRDTLDEYAKASREKDYQKLCDDLLASELVERIRSAGLPCEVALRTGLEGRNNPTLTVTGLEVNGDQALARVHGEAIGEVPADTTYRLVREDGDWRIATPPGSGAEVPGAP